MFSGSVSGLLSLPQSLSGSVLLGWRLWCSLLSCGPNAVSGIQKVLNKWVLSKCRPGPCPQGSPCFGRDFGADNWGKCSRWSDCGESLLLLGLSLSSVKWDQSIRQGGF